MKRPYLLHKRGRIWYYRLADEKTFHTTGRTRRGNAEACVLRILKQRRSVRLHPQLTFRDYAEPFFDWDGCPHVRRFREEGKSITTRHVRIQRGRLEKHVFSDPFANLHVVAVTRADVLDLRTRLLMTNGPESVNKIIGVVKVVFREALYREEIDRDPTAGIGKIKHQKRVRGMFTVDELKNLFPDAGFGPWKDVQDYTCFYLAAVTGARRGELLVLRWRHFDFDKRCLNITDAWKGREVIGLTKSGRPRIVPLSARIVAALLALRSASDHTKPEDFLFCYEDGKRIGETWWRKRFIAALERAGIEPGDRWLTPHSFRHTINTIARDSGHDPAKIRAVLGWMDEEIQDNYTHWQAEHLRKWAEIVDEIWESEL